MTKLKKIIIGILSLIIIVSLTACGKDVKNENENTTKQPVTTTYPLKIKDSYEREVTIDKEPERIISLGPNITEAIYALGKGDKLVGRTDFCDYPEEVKSVESIGSLQTPSIEKIVDLNPDIVIASTHFPKDVLKKLEDLGIKVVALYGEESFDGAYNTLEKMGQVLNTNDKAKEVVDGMKEKVEYVTSKVQGKGTPSVYYVIDFGQYGDYTATKETFIRNMIVMAGGKNVADDAEGWKYSVEKVLEKNPDMVIVSKYFDTKERIKVATGYKDLDAIKKGNLFEIDNNMLDRQGPRLADGLEALAKIIHPEAFK
ncbi:ABC transporter substrate-binding protein [Clostridium sp. MSJ-11]|uniref:ABC transporter substrate-binding protein n=1 Tax=Clostridium mobile TaxID=2841512 RepID=A0ABS6EK87_9CLOT|nr:ABC transporter substrate-binding protein [Clostridium mobile]MBU5485628.1 ABC transporter substrate-binding protein [Clostridium mobile]